MVDALWKKLGNVKVQKKIKTVSPIVFYLEMTTV